MADNSSTGRTVLTARAANLFVGAIKLAAGIIVGSSAMLAEAAQSAADTFQGRLTFVNDTRQVVGLGLAAQAMSAELSAPRDWLLEILTDERLQPASLLPPTAFTSRICGKSVEEQLG